MSAPVQDTVRKVAEEVAAAFGLEVFDVEGRTSGRRWWFRITLDREGGEVSLEDCESVSRQLSVRLDVEDAVPNAYDLEVSSPGVERPLRRERDFRRFAGQRARIVLGPGGPDAGLAHEGVLGGYESDEAILIDEAGGSLRIPLGRIKLAHLLFHFHPR